MRIAKDDVPKTAFRTRYDYFEFFIVPIGRTDASASFVSIVNNIFHDVSENFVVEYFDEIPIYSTFWEEDMKHLKLVLSIPRQNNLYGNLGVYLEHNKLNSLASYLRQKR